MVPNRQRPFGMQDYKTWFEPIKNGNWLVSLSDIDAVLQSNYLDACIVTEFKPWNAEITTGQEKSLKWFSKINRKCYGIFIQDPWYNDNSGEKRDHEVLITVTIYNNGRLLKKLRMTVPELNMCYQRWWNTGVFVD